MPEEKNEQSVAVTALPEMRLDIESGAKLVAVISAACLGSAFVVDMIFFYILDRRFIYWLVLSDHIETAVSIIPLMLVAFGCHVAVLNAHPKPRPPVKRFLSLIALVISAGLVTVVLRYTFFFSWVAITVIWVTAIAVTIATVVFLGARDPESQKWRERRIEQLPLQRMTVFLVGVWTFLVILIATTSAYSVRKVCDLPEQEKVKRLSDVVTLDKGATITGQLVRHINRGAIVMSCKPFAFQFVPADQIKKIDIYFTQH